jgi:hypothetical protein
MMGFLSYFLVFWVGFFIGRWEERTYGDKRPDW